MNAARKYVASRTIVPTWNNTYLLKTELTKAVRDFKASDGPDIAVLGSGGSSGNVRFAAVMSWSPMQHRGTLVKDGEYATLTFRRIYRHSPVHVWEAIATPKGLRAWLMCTHAVIDGHVGGRVELVSGPAGYRSTGKILVWEPPRVLEYEWNVAPVPEMPRGEHAIFRYELTPEGDSTQLLVTYRRITKQTAHGFLPGLHAFLDRLEAQLDGRALPDWTQRFDELRTRYPEWSGHAPDPGK